MAIDLTGTATGFDPAYHAALAEEARLEANAAQATWLATHRPAAKRHAAERTYHRLDAHYWLLVRVLADQGYGSDGTPLFTYAGDDAAWDAGTATTAAIRRHMAAEEAGR